MSRATLFHFERPAGELCPSVRSFGLSKRRASPASRASLRRSMLVAFEPRAAAPGIPRQCITCSLGRRLESLSDRPARCGPGKFLPRVMGGGGRRRQAPTKRLLLEQVLATGRSAPIRPCMSKCSRNSSTATSPSSTFTRDSRTSRRALSSRQTTCLQIPEPLAVRLRRLPFFEKLAVGGGMAPPDVRKSAVQLF
jgi:hypothetical protein